MNPPQPIEHQHKFVIPVEWEYIPHKSQDIPGGAWPVIRERINNDCKIVTKLRCECGEEIER